MKNILKHIKSLVEVVYQPLMPKISINTLHFKKQIKQWKKANYNHLLIVII